MNAPNAYPAEVPVVPEPLHWLEFLIIGIAVLVTVALAIIAPLRRSRRAPLVTDLLR